MRKIQKTISLEPMASRLPSVLPAYLDNKLYYFDDDSLRARKYEYTSNWGFVPVNIILDRKPSSSYTYDKYNLVSGTHSYGNISVNEEMELIPHPYDEFEHGDDGYGYTLSFDTFSKWYHFFEEYYNLLNNYGHCSMIYSSATEYYIYESKSNYAAQMIYGTDEQTYIDLDIEFTEKGGIVSSVTENFKTSYVDAGLYNWMCENIVPRFTIPFEYRNYWNRTTLFYPDVIKELAWFAERLDYDKEGVNLGNYQPNTDNEVELWDCKNTKVDDCCDCEKYFGKGGRRTYDAMVEWYNNVQGNIETINEIVSGSVNSFIPTIILPTELQNSVEDLGEFSIFSKDYELGTDYRTVETVSGNVRTTIKYDNGNTHGGTVVTVSGDSMMLKNDSGSGFYFDPVLMEKNYADTAFTSYSQAYIDSHEDEFNITEFDQYCFTEDNRKVTWDSSTRDDRKAELFSEIYQITPTDSMYIDGNLYDIRKREYGVYDYNDPYIGGKTYFVYREKNTDTPYTFINGKRIYASLYNDGREFVYYFPFFKNPKKTKRTQNCGSSEIFNIDDFKTFTQWSKNISDTGDTQKEYIVYNGIEYIVEDVDKIPSLSAWNDGDSKHKDKLIKQQERESYDDFNTWNVTGETATVIDNSSDCELVVSRLSPTVSDDLIIRIDGFFQDRNGMNYYCSGSTVYIGKNKPPLKYDIQNRSTSGNGCTRISVSDDSTLGKTERYWYCKKETTINTDAKGKWCIVYRDITDTIVYDAKIVTGKTVSKIYDLRSNELLVDDIGRTLEGVYKVRPDYVDDKGGTNPAVYKKYSQPPQYGEIEPIYQVGNTANIRRFSMTVQDEDEIGSGNTNYFVGDIITEMSFYYCDGSGKPIESTRRLASNSALEAIKSATTAKSTVSKERVVLDDIYCDITYYVGATLSRKINEKYKLATEYNHGVKYTETVRFPKTVTKYYLRMPNKAVLPIDELKPSNNDICFPIYIYKLEQDKTVIDSKLYETSYEAALANFETIINVKNGSKWEYDNWKDMAKRNNLEVFPVFREEYKMGISTIEKIDTDIYIDRGINASFEKHLKLGEVYSLEALEQYGNGYFKIIEG